MGFSPVYDYAAGKADWMAANLPTEGARAGEQRARDLATWVPTAAPGATVTALRDLIDDRAVVVVVSENNVVLGVVEPSRVRDAPDDAIADAIMRPGPSTWRPDTRADEFVEELEHRKAHRALVTTNDGVLVGLVDLGKNPDVEHDKRVESVPLETEDGVEVIAQQNVGAGIESGGGEYPDPHTPAEPPAPGAATTATTGEADLAGVIAEFEAEGFTGQLIPIRDGYLRCVTCNTATHADELQVHNLRRLEGASDPDDMLAVVALTCPACGTRGTVALTYGPETSPEEAEVLLLLESAVRRAR